MNMMFSLHVERKDLKMNLVPRFDGKKYSNEITVRNCFLAFQMGGRQRLDVFITATPKHDARSL